ncbi:sigma 54-interacting transcriptional regulator [Thalassotalea sp. M1531]|uniref:HTH-type transcriptional regulatory protein TyrR n=1 Tax=Thalassotalea algicola TaxID=2716224 RepID=A0A7Y0LEK6_9GAMM|nr:sigma 54-interacting transcriptional regulator [Thalassotalea algicola]NMP32813.1 sigma 54-interacting transcriptional regulator [Thalassotalea algicola]
MRVEITSKDRIGISQEILSTISQLGLNVKAMEVGSGLTSLHISQCKLSFNQIRVQLLKVVGVIDCFPIELLPTESREQHLQALLKRIPDPIFDIDTEGKVISCNYQSHIYTNKHIESLFSIPLETVKHRKASAVEVSFEDKVYHAEITPLWAEGGFNGAVIILKSLNRIGHQIAMFQSGNEASDLNNIIGKSKAIETLKQQVKKFSSLDLPLLINGETGTGKELVARAIHQQSERNEGPFLAINCASLPEQLLESELFGYVAGAFTGANEQGKPGLFELANGGTVFLDEVAEMSVYLQAKLLRFLQDYSFRRLGGTKEYIANIRIISASHQPFEVLVTEGRFREDLYYRLNVLNLSLPPLRERKDDIGLLSEYFIAKAAEQVNMQKPSISVEALAHLASYNWPGNIRQLQSVMFRLVALSNSHQLQLEEVETILKEFNTGSYSEENSLTMYDVKSWQEAQEIFERSLLAQLYPSFPSTRKLAQRLRVSHNKIAMKLRQYGIGH